MTRDEAVDSPIDLAIWEFDNAIKGTEEDDSVYPNYCIHIDEYKTALKALLWMKGPQPDPETGLMPCGCGGKAKLVVLMDSNYYIQCEKCGFRSGVLVGWEAAREATKHNWNRAMGLPDTLPTETAATCLVDGKRQ